jgi:hypothetical protein
LNRISCAGRVWRPGSAAGALTARFNCASATHPLAGGPDNARSAVPAFGREDGQSMVYQARQRGSFPLRCPRPLSQF